MFTVSCTVCGQFWTSTPVEFSKAGITAETEAKEIVLKAIYQKEPDPAWGVDIIIGGHSHTFIEEPAVVNDILIVQAGTGTDGQPINDTQLFTMGIPQYQYTNLKKIFDVDLAEIEENGKARIIATSIRDILREYLAFHQHIYQIRFVQKRGNVF